MPRQDRTPAGTKRRKAIVLTLIIIATGTAVRVADYQLHEAFTTARLGVGITRPLLHRPLSTASACLDRIAA